MVSQGVSENIKILKFCSLYNLFYRDFGGPSVVQFGENVVTILRKKDYELFSIGNGGSQFESSMIKK